jgi:pimeloyl-ACP methyl ester carboxylesterase
MRGFFVVARACWSDAGPQRSHWRFAALVGGNNPPQTAATVLRAWCSALQNLRGRLYRPLRGVRLASFPASYYCIKAFSETDQTEDLKKFDVPTLIIQGDDDQIVPYANASLLQAKLIKGANLKIYKGAPHGLCTTLKERVNADLLEFFKGAERVVA